MGAVNLPNNIQNGDDLDADEVMANDQALAQVVNGELEAVSNVSVAAAVTQNGQQNLPGSASTLARSDHLHVIQGFENLTADPTTGNFVGRTYTRTTDGALRYCTNASGSGTFITIGNQAAADVAIHAAQHALGGHDPLPANILDESFFKAKNNLYSATLGADVNAISAGGFTDIIPSLSVTTTGIQTLGIWVTMRIQQVTSGTPNVGFRVVDVTNANTTIYRSDPIQANVGQQQQISGYFYYTTPAGGARVLKVQAGTSSGGNTNVLRVAATFNTETFAGPTIQAAIV